MSLSSSRQTDTPQQGDGFSAAERIVLGGAIALPLCFWGLLFWTGQAGLASLLIGLFLAVMLYCAALAMRSARLMRAETARLKAAVDALRQAYVAQATPAQTGPAHPALLKRLDEISSAQRGLEATLSMLGGMRQADNARPAAQSPPQSAEEEIQPSLSLGTPADALNAPLRHDDFIRALHFPETAEDEAGFAALRRALKDRQAAKLIQAAQDILTLMSQDGIYMDDLRPDMARPEIWRDFSKGARGREVAALGGIRDRASLALVTGRMREDPIFRDAAHHFLRHFDQQFSLFEEKASDEEIGFFATTRTARAFMLLGRVAGTFD